MEIHLGQLIVVSDDLAAGPVDRIPAGLGLGCDAVDSPTGIARISNPALGYDLMMCNSCGRFLKERPRRGLGSLLVERTITAELDVAAEQRGLRI